MFARTSFRKGVVAVLVVSCLAAACSSDNNDNTATGGNNVDTSNPACTGAPLRFTSIGSLTGPLTYASLVEEARFGQAAALKAVNDECALGRPIEVISCDDKSDPNEATACGREAKENGSLALLGSTGGFDGGTTAAGLPGILTGGGNVFDLTNPQSFPIQSPLTLVVGGSATAAAANVTDGLLVSLDSGATRTFAGTAQDVAKNLGVNLDTLFFPVDTTDFAPVAAQISERNPGGLGLIVTNGMVPFMNALAAEGITPHDIPIFTAVLLVPPEVLDQLGEKADGMYLLTQQAPPSDTDNPGIQQMLKELKDASIEKSGDDMSPAVTAAWSNIHALVDILKTLPPEEIASLDSAKLVAAMANKKINRPEIAASDFSVAAFPDIPALASFRLYSRDAMVVKVTDGKYERVSQFSDATKPFKLEN